MEMGLPAGAAAAGAVTPMGWLMAGSSVLSSLVGGSKSAPAGPSNASSYTEQIFDNSGWTVATGGSKADAVASDGLQMPPWLLLGVAAVLVVGWVRTRK